MEGTTFCISDDRGDVGTYPAGGLFVRDTRVLSRWRLAVEGRPLQPLQVHQEAPYAASFVLLASTDGPGAKDLLVTRDRFVGDGMREDLTLRNATSTPTEVVLHLEVDADFSDLFEVKEGHERPTGVVDVEPTEHRLRLSVVRDGSPYAVLIDLAAGATFDGQGLRWEVALGDHATWSTSIQVVPELRGHRLVPHHPPGTPTERAAPAVRHRAFRGNAPRLATPDAALAAVLGRSMDDLATLRIFDPTRPDLPVVAAGAPWFMALFGRDSLLTSMMLLPVDSGLALGTLLTLAGHLGIGVDPITDEQPGRVPHEVRFGPAGTLALGGRTVYYGSADATPLFVMALGELLRWQPDLVSAELVTAADRALEWMLTAGDPDHDGFIEYRRGSDRGLVNQGWKDSWDGVNFADGTLAEPPIALAEVQGYAYAAYLARAAIAASFGDQAGRARWERRASDLKAAFDAAFWLPDRGWYAIGLDRHKRPIDALTSNNGHLLWTGIAEQDKAAVVAAHLHSPRLFSGWGVRTLATDMGAYNPLSYHNGSVWPHDTAICVAGLMRYGHVAAAQEIALGLLDASVTFGGRLPELFAGVDRAEVVLPVPYPAACSPQAWAASAPFELVRALLGMRPGPEGLECDPHVPDRMLPLRLERVSCGRFRYDVDVDRRGWRVSATPEVPVSADGRARE